MSYFAWPFEHAGTESVGGGVRSLLTQEGSDVVVEVVSRRASGNRPVAHSVNFLRGDEGRVALAKLQRKAITEALGGDDGAKQGIRRL